MTSDWRIVTQASPRSDHNAVRRMDNWLSREADLGISPFNWRPEKAAKHPDWEAWLVGSRPTAGAIFTKGGLRGAAWHLDRVWVAPDRRRHGLLSAIWPTWMERYDSISTDPSLALKGFLRSHGWEPVEFMGVVLYWCSPGVSLTNG